MTVNKLGGSLVAGGFGALSAKGFNYRYPYLTTLMMCQKVFFEIPRHPTKSKTQNYNLG